MISQMALVSKVGTQYGHQLGKLAGQYSAVGAAMADTAATTFEREAKGQAAKMLGKKVRPLFTRVILSLASLNCLHFSGQRS
jgi:hypothetical protein